MIPRNELPPPLLDPSLLLPEHSLAMARTDQPALSPPTPDPSVELLDGSRTVEVTALFGDSVLQVRHLGDLAAGRVSARTWIVGGVGWGLFAAGAVLAVVGQLGLASLVLPLGLGLAVYARSRVRAERRSPHFSLGEASEADLHLSSTAIPASCFPLVEATHDGHVLNFTPAMRGDVTVGAERMDLETLARTGHALPGALPQTYSFPIPTDARIRVEIEENTFLVSSVAPAKQVHSPVWAGLDWSTQAYGGVSLGAHALALFLVFVVPPDGRSLSLDLFDTDNRSVPIRLTPVQPNLIAPEDFLTKKTPADLGKGGAPHRGEMGKAGSKEAKQRNRRMALRGPKNNPNPALSRHLAEQAVKEVGIPGLLGPKRGSRIATIFGRDSALGDEAEEALGNLIGNQVGDAWGLGGLGPVGAGRGGGGTADGVGMGGPLDTIGKGGRGPGGGRYGALVGQLKPNRKAGIPKVAGRVIIKGGLDREIIRRVVRRNINQVRFCYQKELQSKPDLWGRVVVKFSIIGNGQVVTAAIESSTLGSSETETCIAQAVRRWLFPKPMGGGTVIVSYPFVLRAAGAE